MRVGEGARVDEGEEQAGKDPGATATRTLAGVGRAHCYAGGAPSLSVKSKRTGQNVQSPTRTVDATVARAR